MLGVVEGEILNLQAVGHVGSIFRAEQDQKLELVSNSCENRDRSSYSQKDIESGENLVFSVRAEGKIVNSLRETTTKERKIEFRDGLNSRGERRRERQSVWTSCCSGKLIFRSADRITQDTKRPCAGKTRSKKSML